jgi:hypothetical protein
LTRFYAKKLVRAFGEAVFDVVEGDPKRLPEVGRHITDCFTVRCEEIAGHR